MSEEKKEGYELLQTKVSTKAAERLNRIARNRGTTTYGLIQLVCQFLIRTASGDYNLSDDINRLLTLFHLEPGWKDAYNSCDPTADTEIAQEILILQQPGRRGFGAVMVNKPFMGAWTETECVDDIIERIIEVCAPQKAVRDTQVGVHTGAVGVAYRCPGHRRSRRGKPSGDSAGRQHYEQWTGDGLWSKNTTQKAL